jgi:hypothetical protein
MPDTDYLSKLLMEMQRRLETLERGGTGGGGGGGITIDDVYPIGSIYLSVNSTNPSSIFGGTWVAWGSGKVPVGVDTNDTDFDTVEESGGAKTHQHVYGFALSGYYQDTIFEGDPNTGALQDGNGNPTGWGSSFVSSSVTPNGNNVDSTRASRNSNHYKSTADTSATSTLQPYITCFMWKRTA